MARPKKDDDEVKIATVTVRFPKPLHERYKKLSKDCDRPISWLVRRAAELALEDLERLMASKKR
jgi:predicted DNA-binding protein